MVLIYYSAQTMVPPIASPWIIAYIDQLQERFLVIMILVAGKNLNLLLVNLSGG